MTAPADVREFVAKSRAAQGLPPVITDEATLVRVAGLLGLPPSSKGKHADAAGISKHDKSRASR